MIRRALVLCALLFALSGCATMEILKTMRDDPTADLFDVLSKVAKEDLQAALADATAHDDQIAGLCYVVLMKYADKEWVGATGRSPVLGAFSAFQRARDLRAQVAGGIPSDLRVGCSALLLDTRNFILKMGALSRGVSIP